MRHIRKSNYNLVTLIGNQRLAKSNVAYDVIIEVAHDVINYVTKYIFNRRHFYLRIEAILCLFLIYMISYLLTIRQKHVVNSFTAMCAYLMRSRTEFSVLKSSVIGSYFQEENPRCSLMFYWEPIKRSVSQTFFKCHINPKLGL